MTPSERLIKSLTSASNGLTISELTTLHPDLPRRSIQRWLKELTEEGQIIATGKGPARRYQSPKIPPSSRGKAENDRFPDFIPLSPDSREVLSYIDQPLEKRRPVGYHRDFLDAYDPNRTWYLPGPLRRQLHKIGNTGQEGLPAGTYGRAILNRFLIDLSWASSHLEGNTYSRLDTRELIERGQAAQGKAAAETQMILNHKTAIELIVTNIEAVGFNRYTLFNLHSALSENLLPNPSDEGRVRQHMVGIGSNVYRPPEVPAQIDELLDLLLQKAAQIVDPFEQSFFAMVHLPYLQPFADVNKRTSRLMANIPLIRANLCPLTFLDVPEGAYSRATLGVYELNRVELLRDLYLWAYERSTHEYLAIKQNFAEPDPLRLTYRETVRQIIRETIENAGEDSPSLIQRKVMEQVPEPDRQNVQALVMDELRRLHEGSLGRYGLRAAQFARWRERQRRG